MVDVEKLVGEAFSISEQLQAILAQQYYVEMLQLGLADGEACVTLTVDALDGCALLDADLTVDGLTDVKPRGERVRIHAERYDTLLQALDALTALTMSDERFQNYV
jgi:hypothetical protein